MKGGKNRFLWKSKWVIMIELNKGNIYIVRMYENMYKDKDSVFGSVRVSGTQDFKSIPTSLSIDYSNRKCDCSDRQSCLIILRLKQIASNWGFRGK